MINVLINAYAVSPNWGSEPGMGWNWVINIAKFCNVHVITEGEWRTEIEEACKTLPQQDNIHFYYNPVSEKVRRICWNQGDWRFYWYYRKWQKKTLEIAKDVIAKNKIDVMHQLNMIGFREPGYLWKIKNIPLVWGPVGGMGYVPLAYRRGQGIKQCILSTIKYGLSDLQLRYHPRVNRMMRQSYVFGAVKAAYDKILKFYGKEIILISETGTYNNGSKSQRTYDQGSTLNILWAGRLIPTKRLDIALKAICQTRNKNVMLTVCGVGSDEEEAYYRHMIQELGISSQVNWMGRVPHEQMSDLMNSSDLFFMTSVADATSTVIVEAISSGLPILSFNACGFGTLVKEFAGETIELTTLNQSVSEFAQKINELEKHRERLKMISSNQAQNLYTLSWDYKGKKMVEIYTSIINNKK